jgi:hypothetical protein
MSLTARTKYLARTVIKVQSLLEPLVDTYNEVIEAQENLILLVTEELSQLQEDIDRFSAKGLNSALNILKEKEELLKEKLIKIPLEYALDAKEYISNAINNLTLSFSGVKISTEITARGKLSVKVEPELFNDVSDLVKDTLISPETVVTAAAGPYPLVPVGSTFIKTT